VGWEKEILESVFHRSGGRREGKMMNKGSKRGGKRIKKERLQETFLEKKKKKWERVSHRKTWG